MPVLKLCSCGDLIEVNSKCSKCRKEKSRDRYRNSKYNIERLYNTERWKKARRSVKARYKNICIWSFYKEGRVMEGTICHHIELACEENFYDKNNLVMLSHEAHEKVHSLYDSGKYIESVNELKEMQKKWMEDMGKD